MDRTQVERAVAFTDDPPSRGTCPYLPVLRPAPNASVRGIILCGKVTGVLTHYLDERTGPHLRDKAVCEGCKRNQVPRYIGYIAILEARLGRICLAQLSKASVESNLFLKDRKHNLRGWMLDVQRLGKERNARCAATVSKRSIDGPLPPDPDVVGALLRMWHVYHVVQVNLETGGEE